MGGLALKFGDRIRFQREELELSREELAAKLGVSYYTLSKYENNTNEPNFATLVKIASVLTVTTDYLLGAPDHDYSTDLLPEEKNILNKYRTLPEEGKARLKNQLDFEFSQAKAKDKRSAAS